MKAGKYSIKELFSNRHVEQIVIPEIQRDYVWGKKEVEGLLSSIHNDFKEFKNGDELILQPNVESEIKNALERFYKRQKFSCNIGFIYAYNDPEYAGKYFLIDGQQRLTTIYLLLLVLASEKNDFRDKFEKLYMFSDSPIIDFRVREASRLFLTKIVNHYKNEGIDIGDQPWFHKDYIHDKTITSITANIEIIKNYIKEQQLVGNEFINYVQDFIEFWYFDTNISEQGEELYIYMNARGEQLQENESLKADLLGQIQLKDDKKSLIQEKNEWGKIWEEWQDFFWKKKMDNPNADKGFNEFINCIAGLENYLSNKNLFYTKEDFDGGEKGRKNQISYPDILSSFEEQGLEKIKSYIEGLQYLFNSENIAKFKSNYENISWVDDCLKEILKILNSNSTNWFADINDDDRGLEHSRMVFVWSLLLYMKNNDVETKSNTEIYRVLRRYYIRFNNYNRSVKNIKFDVKNFALNGIWKQERTEEEKKKNVWFSEINPNDIYKFEEIIWSIEDHPFNLDGRDANAINCSHLVDLDVTPSIQELTHIKDKFYELFPVTRENKVSGENYKKLTNILLFYGEFWKRVSPWYYSNLRFDSWKKIIRNIDPKNEAFKLFFNDFKTQTLEEIYNETVILFEVDKETRNKAEQLKWFAAKLGERMWNQGFHIAIDQYNPVEDKIFIRSKPIINTKGNFKGGSPQILSELI